MNWYLFYYNSLPEMPAGCALFSPDIPHRDFFRCNPSNTGHHEYPKFELPGYDEGCHHREVARLLANTDPDRHVVLYTRRTPLVGQSDVAIVGYFKVGQPYANNGKRGFFASKAVLLPRSACIPICYGARGVPCSWGKATIRNDVDRILNELRHRSGPDVSARCKTETARMMTWVRSAQGRDRIIRTCGGCSARQQCFWGRCDSQRQRARLDDLYGGVPACCSARACKP